MSLNGLNKWSVLVQRNCLLFLYQCAPVPFNTIEHSKSHICFLKALFAFNLADTAESQFHYNEGTHFVMSIGYEHSWISVVVQTVGSLAAAIIAFFSPTKSFWFPPPPPLLLEAQYPFMLRKFLTLFLPCNIKIHVGWFLYLFISLKDATGVSRRSSKYLIKAVHNKGHKNTVGIIKFPPYRLAWL